MKAGMIAAAPAAIAAAKGILTPGSHRTIAAQVLGRHRDASGAAKSRPLKTARLGRGKLGCDPGILAGTLDNASPAWVAGDIDHGREGQVDTVRGGLRRRRARRARPGIWVEQTGFCQWHRENRAVTVHDIESHQQRNAKARMLHREPLQGLYLNTPHVENVADTAAANAFLQLVPRAGTCDRA